MSFAEYLMQDQDFLEKRIKEQDDYLYDIEIRMRVGNIDYNRYLELKESALHQRLVFIMRRDGIVYSGDRDGRRVWFKNPGYFIGYDPYLDSPKSGGDKRVAYMLHYINL